MDCKLLHFVHFVVRENEFPFLQTSLLAKVIHCYSWPPRACSALKNDTRDQTRLNTMSSFDFRSLWLNRQCQERLLISAEHNEYGVCKKVAVLWWLISFQICLLIKVSFRIHHMGLHIARILAMITLWVWVREQIFFPLYNASWLCWIYTWFQNAADKSTVKFTYTG